MALAPAVNALAAAQGVTHAAEQFFRYGGADDPLFLKYRRVRAMGKGGADGAIFRAIVIAGALEGQIPALKYRNPGDDPQREIHQDPARKRAPKRSLAAAQGVPNRSEGQSYRLGLCGREYVRSTESPEAAVQQLLKARDAVQKEWSELLDGDTDALGIVRKVRVVLSNAVKVAPRIFPHDDTAYVVTSVARKVVIAMLSSGRATTDWASMRRAELEELCCEEIELLKRFPETWSAAEISDFIFGRPDWAIFVSLFGCLLRDAIKIAKVSSDKLLRCLASPMFGGTAQDLRAQCGHAVHPAIVLQELHRQGHC